VGAQRCKFALRVGYGLDSSLRWNDDFGIAAHGLDVTF
jgi:hypothetical protein